MGIPDHLTCLLQNLYAVQEATNRTGHGTRDFFKIEKGIQQDCIIVTCLFTLYAEYIRQNAELDEVQAGIKIARRNVSDLRDFDDTILMAKSEEELKNLLMKVKKESGEKKKNWLKLNIQKPKIMAFSPIISWQIDGESGDSDRIFPGLKNYCRW